jgi:hypothetical protein
MNNAKRWSLSVFTALLAAVVFTACENTPLSNESRLAPEGLAQLSTSGTTYQKLEGQIPTFSVSGEIGPEGGTIGVEGFKLVVPAGAVKVRALFEFASRNSGYVEVSLHATAVGSTDHNNVGRAGFSKPVQVHIRFHPAGGPKEWRKHRVVWVRDDGALVPMKTLLYPGPTFTAVGYVPHFSDYAIGFPDAL